jgi:hypothetical protein
MDFPLKEMVNVCVKQRHTIIARTRCLQKYTYGYVDLAQYSVRSTNELMHGCLQQNAATWIMM